MAQNLVIPTSVSYQPPKSNTQIVADRNQL